MMAFGSADSHQDLAQFLEQVMGKPPTRAQVSDLRRRYDAIGGSPLREITLRQAKLLERRFIDDPSSGDVRVAVGMRHGEPGIGDALGELRAAGVTEVVAIPMAPQQSPDQQGYRDAIDRALAGMSDPPEVVMVRSWHNDRFLVDALAERCATALRDAGTEAPIFFTAHSLPAQMPGVEVYVAELEATAQAVATAVGVPRRQRRVVFQSVPPGRSGWLRPTLQDSILGLEANVESAVVVCPIQFVADHLEVLYDIDIEANALAHRMGVEQHRTESLNFDPRLIEALYRSCRARFGT